MQLSGIDPTYYEAATVDGASKWQRIRNNHPSVDTACDSIDHPCSQNIFRAVILVFLPNPSQRWSAYSNKRIGRLCL